MKIDPWSFLKLKCGHGKCCHGGGFSSSYVLVRTFVPNKYRNTITSTPYTVIRLLRGGINIQRAPPHMNEQWVIKCQTYFFSCRDKKKKKDQSTFTQCRYLPQWRKHLFYALQAKNFLVRLFQCRRPSDGLWGTLYGGHSQPSFQCNTYALVSVV